MSDFSLVTWRQRAAHPLAIAGVLFLAALLLRAYRLSSNLLWLDEIYGYQLGQLGPAAIVRNSSFDPHPPLFYLIEYVTSGFGMVRSEWALRWLSVLSGAISVPLLYLLAKRTTSWFSALLSTVLFLFSPAQIFFSQEARPYALLVCLAILSALLILQIQDRPTRRVSWIGVVGLALVGLWCSYTYILVVGVQLLYLAITLRSWRSVWLCGGAIVLGCVPLVGASFATLSKTQAIHLVSAPVTPWLLIQQLLTVDYERYGLFWANDWVPATLLPVALLGVWRAIRQWRRGANLYYVMQLALPLFAFFGLAVGLLHMRLPTYEWRQFLIISPALFVLLALGLDHLQMARPRIAGQAVAGAIGVLVIYASILGLQRYWTTQKSPEGEATVFVRDHMRPDDAVVSLHYSLNATISFYMPNTVPYTNPQPSDVGLVFMHSTFVVPVAQPQPTSGTASATIRQHSRIWLLYLATQPALPPAELVEGCTQAERHDFPPFRVVLLRDCS